MSTLPPLYQLAVTPGGTWRARVFNLPPHREGQPPVLPFLRALAARPGAWARDWQQDPEEKLTVLRLAGSDQPSLDLLLAHLRAHGIALVATVPGPARKRAAGAVSA